MAHTKGNLDLYNADFTILDESADWIVVDKPAHLLVHPSKPGNPPTLLDELEQLMVFEIATGGKLSIINRLDRETSGIVLVAKHREAAKDLAKSMAAKEFTKLYRAIVHGWPDEDSFEINQPILRKGSVSESEIHLRQTVHPRGKPCVTGFEVLNRFQKDGGRFSLLQCHLRTGRMHQIRAHLEFAGHPLVGDKIYGHSGEPYLRFIENGWTPELETDLLLNRQALHAAELIWRDHHWKSSLPIDLEEFLKK